jgi:hypothetical protein
MLWMVRAGEGGRFFSDFRREGIVALGWNKLKDISHLSDQDEIKRALEKAYPDQETDWYSRSAGTIKRFIADIQNEENVITNGPDQKFLVGVVKSEVKSDGRIPEYPHTRQVEWKGEVSRESLSEPTQDALSPQQTVFQVSEAAEKELLERVGTAQTSKRLVDPEVLERVLRERRTIWGATWPTIWSSAEPTVNDIKGKLLATGSSLVDVETLQKKLPSEMATLTAFLTPAGTTASQVSYMENKALPELLGKLPTLKDYDEIRQDLLNLEVPYLGVSAFSTLASFIRPDLFMPYYSGVHRGTPELQLPRIQGGQTDFGAYLDLMKLFKEANEHLGISNMYETGYFLSKGAVMPSWWVEVTSATDHQDPTITAFDSQYGHSLHSPQKDKSGGDSYRRMREIKAGDRILHYDLDLSQISGVSIVKERFESLGEEKYFVNLQDYQPLEPPIKWEDFRTSKDKELRDALHEGGSAFYSEFHQEKDRTELRINKKYLCRASAPVVEVVDKYYHDSTGNHIPHYSTQAQVKISVVTRPVVPPDYPRNIILYGPVGTGKTYLARKIAFKLATNDLTGLSELLRGMNVDIPDFAVEFKQLQGSRIFFVTFHKSYSYEQFVIGITARTSTANQIEYPVEDGVFKQICELAGNDKENNYVLIIDEINRGDISKVFGELITLLEEDKRIGASNEILVRLPYRKPDGSTEKFGVPLNLYIIGTMNTTDRSIALLDVALRRRFRTFEIGPNYDFIRQNVSDPAIRDGVVKTLISINNRISAYKGPDFTIGHVYFRNLGPNPKKGIRDAWYNQILPLLLEYFYDDYKTLKEKILNKTNFVNPLDNKDQAGKATDPVSIINKEYLDDAKLDEFYQEFTKIASTPEA